MEQKAGAPPRAKSHGVFVPGCAPVISSREVASGKSHHDENFPVASWLVEPRHRRPILAFYRFVRAADDVADHARLAAKQKLDLIDRLEDTLLGNGDAEPVAVALRAALGERQLSPRHAQELLRAFRLDVSKSRYQDWDDLMAYCRYSAMPVGRFVLDVHGESPATWPANDALCAALQVINHLQDCAVDYQRLDRIYIPLEGFDREHESVEALGGPRSSPALRKIRIALANRTAELLRQAEPLSCQVKNRRLGLEIAVIHRLAVKLTRTLLARDPLCERVHLSKPGFAVQSTLGLLEGLWNRAVSRRALARRVQDA